MHLLVTTKPLILRAQESQKPKPTFVLSIEEDKDAACMNPGFHRLLVKLTHTSIGVEVDQFHEEAEGMYNMIVLRDGLPVKETDAMRDLRNYRKVDDNPNIRNPRLLKFGESWTTRLDVSDYYDMREPGTYQVTVTRESAPLNLDYSLLVRSNTIAIVVPQDVRRTPSEKTDKPKPRLSLIISTLQSNYVPPNGLKVEIENTSTSMIRERKCWPFLGMYNLIVFRNGEPLEGNDGIQRLQKSRAAVDCPGNETLMEIKPGDSYADSLPLSDFYDVYKPGSYAVYVTRETYPWNPAKSVLVESNTINFVVPQTQ